MGLLFDRGHHQMAALCPSEFTPPASVPDKDLLRLLPGHGGETLLWVVSDASGEEYL